MSDIEATGKRPRGRPPTRSDDETRHLIAEAAQREFMAHGYAGACMDDVAKGAGVSKKTLYRLIPAKAELFKISVTDRIARFMLAVDEETTGSHDVATALERLLIEFGNLTLSAETIAIQKLVAAESDRFPELAASFYADAILTTYAAMEAFLARQCALGALELDDPHIAAGMLRGMMVMEPQRAVILGKAAVPTIAEIAQRARICARLFLKGCLKDRARTIPAAV
ncbi:TetR/AcrR family transcriptional regulator [Methylocapsa sp. S129]|uniref:TetR/AcrR family transcriptional regulator n=1 Tax=Methylocapsa sp. S129 TaxID=1641869 RepID=UPI00131CADD8|nr:TetR/AcrR family transcriptional regulator [Methylocapsa sp. S129]